MAENKDWLSGEHFTVDGTLIQAWAGHLVSEMQSPSRSITLINVHEDAGLRYARTYVGSEAIESYLKDLSRQELDPAIELLEATDVEHHVDIRTGHVAQQIVDFAHEGAFELIVLGAKGRSAITDLLIGSIAQRVLATAKTPVLLLKQPASRCGLVREGATCCPSIFDGDVVDDMAHARCAPGRMVRQVALAPAFVPCPTA